MPRPGIGSFLVALMGLAGCAVTAPLGGAIPRDAVARLPDFPGCDQAQSFLFAGESTLAAVGLGQHFGGPDGQRLGMIWITAEPVDLHGPGPPPPGPVAPPARAVCVEWPDGSGMAGPLPDGWQPPGGVELPENRGAAAGSTPPIGLLVLVAAGVAVAGVSWLAFRERPSD